MNLTPAFIWTHDVHGTTPGPGGGFIERRKSFTAALFLDYINRVRVELAYTNLFGGNDFLRDRDSFRFGVSYAY